MLSLAYDANAAPALEARNAPIPDRLPPPPRPDPRTRLRLVERPQELDPILTRRDPAFIRKIFPTVAAVADRYYRAEVEGVENLTDRASLLVSTHNGSWTMPDLYALYVAFWRRFGLETPAFGMAHRAVFSIPGAGEAIAKVGALPASRDNARLVLSSGFPLLVCPGGDVDTLKPFAKRHQIMFGERRGFIRLAIEQGVPVVPVVSVGAHETMFILNDGTQFAETSSIARFFRVKSVPWAVVFPWGLSPAGIFAVPLPSKVRVRVIAPIRLDVPRSAASDPEAVEACFELVRSTMQRELTDLASTRRFPVLG